MLMIFLYVLFALWSFQILLVLVGMVFEKIASYLK